MDGNTIVEIEDLKTNFYTKSGVVYALDGVNLKIRKGETLGLVGESGCGKSVTANSIMRLVPSPPGKVEGGRIMFGLPPGLKMHFERLMDQEVAKGKDDPEVTKVRAEYEQAIVAGDYLIPGLKDVYYRYRELEQQKGRDDPEVVKVRNEYALSLSQINILDLQNKDLQRIRGKVISMIFQEPMASLNPVFTAGDQISEVLLLHERTDLATSVLERLDRQDSSLREYKHVMKVADEKGELQCSNCHTKVEKYLDYCPECNGSFRMRFVPSVSRFKLKMYRQLYERLKANPDDGLLYYMSRVPLVRRYEKPLKYEATERAIGMLRLVRVPDPVNVATSYPYELSGGMQQRVMIAMALACKPQLLIADEPTTALDVTIQAQILKLMRELQKDMGTTILMITHNLGIIAEICDRVGVMYAGNVVELASNHEIFKEPLHPYTQGLLAAIPRIDTELPRLETIEGNVPNLAKPPPGCRFHPRCPYIMDVCGKEKPLMREIRPGHTVACHLYSEMKE